MDIKRILEAVRSADGVEVIVVNYNCLAVLRRWRVSFHLYL